MKQPPVFSSAKLPQHVYKLDKAIYGLKQAPQAWYSQMNLKLQELGFNPYKSDISLFVKKVGQEIVYVLVYVDDIIITSSSSRATDHLIKELQQEFAIKDLGRLHYFLGIEMVLIKEGIILAQKKYIDDLLRRMNMTNCKPIVTPMASTEKFCKDDGILLSADEGSKYRSTMGALQYLTIIRADISFAVNKVSPCTNR